MFTSGQKSCDHMVAQSFMKQVDSPRDSDYPDALITALAERLLKTVGNTHKKNAGFKKKSEERLINTPYVHGVSHRLKKNCKRAWHTHDFQSTSQINFTLSLSKRQQPEEQPFMFC